MIISKLHRLNLTGRIYCCVICDLNKFIKKRFLRLTGVIQGSGNGPLTGGHRVRITFHIEYEARDSP